jgi:hypothetical protein
MEFPFTTSSQSQSISMSTDRRKNSFSWRSMFVRHKASANAIDAFYTQPYSISDPFDRQTTVPHTQSYDIPRAPYQQIRRTGSLLSWSPFGKRNPVENDSPRRTAREVYHQRQPKKSRIPRASPSRSRTIDSHGKRPKISPPLRYPSDQWFTTRHSLEQVGFQPSVGPEEVSEAIFTLTRQPDPEAGITVQYSPRESSWDAVEGRTGPDANRIPVQDLAEYDPDKRNEVFARIHPEGWNQIIPKQWVEDEFSDDGVKTTASQSLYSRDDSEGSVFGQHPQRPTVETERQPAPRLTSSLVKTSGPRFVFEDSDNEGARAEKKSELHEDQVWWRNQTTALRLSSTPYHQNRECSSNCLPCPIETVSQLKRADDHTTPLPKGSRYSDPLQRRELTSLTKSQGRPRINTSPARLMQPPIASPSNKARRTVDEFFNLADSGSLVPAPLRPRHEEPHREQSHKTTGDENRKTTIYHAGEGFPMTSPGNKTIVPAIPDRQLKDGASASSDKSWETVRYVTEEDPGEYDSNRDIQIQPQIEPLGIGNKGVNHNYGRVRGQVGHMQRSNVVENDPEQNVDDILDLYLTRNQAETDSGYATSQHLGFQYGPVRNYPSPEPEYTNPSVSTALQRNSHSDPVPLPVPQARSLWGTPSHARASKPSRRSGGDEEQRERIIPPPPTTTTQHRHGESSFLRQQALFTGDCPQCPGSRRWNGNAEGRRESNSGARLPVTVIDEFGNPWI